MLSAARHIPSPQSARNSESQPAQTRAGLIVAIDQLLINVISVQRLKYATEIFNPELEVIAPCMLANTP